MYQKSQNTRLPKISVYLRKQCDACVTDAYVTLRLIEVLSAVYLWLLHLSLARRPSLTVTVTVPLGRGISFPLMDVACPCQL